MSIAPGDLVTPNVKLVRPLGEGGMGRVWVAHHEGLDAEVAVKFVATDDSADASILERFKREAALSAKIKSPHVVKTFDHGVMDNGEPYIVMELLEGETLGARLGRTKRLPMRDVALIVAQTARVLDEAHGLGVVHRDIKPDNVFLLASEYQLFVKVLDFGIAKQTHKLDVASVTDTGAIVGTPEYMSPEQLLSPKSAGWNADSWALAVIAYRGLTGKVPFHGETLPSLSLNIVGSRFTPATELAPELPAAVDAFFARAFDRDAGARFPSVIALAEALVHALGLAELVDVASTDRTSRDPEPVATSSSGAPGGGAPGGPSSAVTSSNREGSGTLASALSEARPALSHTPEIAVETAPDDPLAPPTLMATPVEPTEVTSSRRRGPVVIEIDRPRSTPRPRSSFQPTPTSVRLDERSKSDGRLKLAGALIVVAMSAAAASLTLRGVDEPRPIVSSTAASGVADKIWDEDVPPLRAPRSASEAPQATERVAEPVPAPEPEPPSPEPPRPLPNGKVALRPRPPPPVAPETSPSSKPKSLAHCYVTEPDGTVTVKEECLR